MGHSTTPKYRVCAQYLNYTYKHREATSFSWNTKRDGLPTVENLKKWRDGMNASLCKGGSNEHLRDSQSDYFIVWIEENNVSSKEVCRYIPPIFEVF